MPSSLRRFDFLLADIQSHHLLQINRSDTLNIAADINITIEKRLKRVVQIDNFVSFIGTGIARFSFGFHS